MQNAEYDFADPVVIIGGDFNTVDPDNIGGVHVYNKISGEKVLDQVILAEKKEMLNQVNWYKGMSFIDAIKNSELGVCSHLTGKTHHKN